MSKPRILLCTNRTVEDFGSLEKKLSDGGATSVCRANDLIDVSKHSHVDIDILMSDRFQKIFPTSLLERFPFSINTHMSLLPKHRGSHALFFCTLAGDAHGWTIHHMDQGIDTGPVISQGAVEYIPSETFRDIHTRTRAEIVRALIAIVQDFPGSLAKPVKNSSHLPQPPHSLSVFGPLFERLPLGWDTPIEEARRLLYDFIDAS